MRLVLFFGLASLTCAPLACSSIVGSSQDAGAPDASGPDGIAQGGGGGGGSSNAGGGGGGAGGGGGGGAGAGGGGGGGAGGGGGGAGAGGGGGGGAAGGGGGGGGTAGGGGGGSASTGPGPYGALPNGYCCTGNGDCRYRTCVGGMCSDQCDSDQSCQGVLPGFACGDAGQCVPSSGTTTCVPADQYQLGSRALGQCCTNPLGNGKTGTECIGGHCDQWGDNPNNPFICDQVCSTVSDCQAFTPGDSYDCINVGTFSLCIPTPAESTGGAYSCNY